MPRARKVRLSLPGTAEKISHGEPTFILKKGVQAMFFNNHHDDGHVVAWIPAAPREQEALIRERPKTFYRPPYVEVKGWVGIKLDQIDDDESGTHRGEAWRFIGKK